MNKIRQLISSFQNKPYIAYLPLLFLYTLIILLFAKEELQGDETRYIYYGNNLLNGFYSPTDNPYLRNGPGYPIFLAPFLLLGLPYLIPTLANGVLLYLSVVLFFHILRKYVNEGTALVGGYLLGLYPVFFRWIVVLSPEALGLFLMTYFIYFYIQISDNQDKRLKYAIYAGICMGILILTKYVFGYIILFMILVQSILFIGQRSRVNLLSILTYSVAFSLAIPYLVYTHSLTGKFFYWGTNGGEQLYWMTSPYQDEMGSWHGRESVLNREVPGMREEHIAFYESVEPLTNVERNEAFKEKAVENLSLHPLMYAKNWVANLGRYLFGYPFSYRKQTLLPLAYIIPNMFVVVPFFLALYPAWLARRKIPQEIWLLMLIFFAYSGVVSLVWAITRYLIPMVPIVFLWLIFMYSHIIKIRTH